MKQFKRLATFKQSDELLINNLLRIEQNIKIIKEFATLLKI